MLAVSLYKRSLQYDEMLIKIIKSQTSAHIVRQPTITVLFKNLSNGEKDRPKVDKT